MLIVGAGCTCPTLSEATYEAVLRTNLSALRDGIDQYERDTGGCLRDLDRLVVEGYFREIPGDPFAENRSEWQLVRDTAGCIRNVRSTSTESVADGTRYRDW